MKNTNLIDNIVKDIAIKKTNINNKITFGGTFIAKTSGIVSGIEMFIQVLEKMNTHNKIYHIKSSQDLVNRGDSLVSIRGAVSDVLAIREIGENLLSSICSVSSTLSKYIQEIKDLDIDVLICENGISEIGEYYDAAVIDGGGMILSKDTMYLPYLVWENIDIEEQVKISNKHKEIYLEVNNLDEYYKTINSQVTHIVCLDFSVDAIKQAMETKNNKIVGIRNNLSFANIRSYVVNNVDFVIINNFYRNLKKFEIEFKYFEN